MLVVDSPPGAHALAAHSVNGSLTKPCEDEELEACLVWWHPGYRSAPAMRSAGQKSPDREAGLPLVAPQAPGFSSSPVFVKHTR